MKAREWGIFDHMSYCLKRGFSTREQAEQRVRDEWAPWELDGNGVSVGEIKPGDVVEMGEELPY